MTLNTQITNILTNNQHFMSKPTDVFIIGHSLGGVVAFGYLAYLKKVGALNGSIPHAPEARLKGVATLDSPIGGVTREKLYQGLIKEVVDKSCHEVKQKHLPLTSVEDLVQIFSTNNGDGHPQGAGASLLQALFQGPTVSNQALAEQAEAVGIPVLTIGNTSDLFWDPSLCKIDGRPIDGDFRTTQWVQDKAAAHRAVYGRDFKDGELKCKHEDFLPNHLAVLHNTTVKIGLSQFFPSGGEPTALHIAPADLPTALTATLADL